MSITIPSLPKIRSVEFLNSSIMFIHLTNDRTFLIPLDQFPAIKGLSPEERADFEIIDDENLSFLAIDEIFSVAELMGVK
ncbi:MAG: DUF2442 domain-containing protein [Flavobacteriales bacterium]|jgi:hypothetical protein|nr:DUF2442 domain-containing protein [Flavobacteriales bacterium]